MSEFLDSNFKPSREVIFTFVGNEAVLLHTGTNTYYGLDPIGGLICQRLADEVPLRVIVDEILATFDVSRERVLFDLRSLMAELLDQGIVVCTPESIQRN